MQRQALIERLEAAGFTGRRMADEPRRLGLGNVTNEIVAYATYRQPEDPAPFVVGLANQRRGKDLIAFRTEGPHMTEAELDGALSIINTLMITGLAGKIVYLANR